MSELNETVGAVMGVISGNNNSIYDFYKFVFCMFLHRIRTVNFIMYLISNILIQTDNVFLGTIGNLFSNTTPVNVSRTLHVLAARVGNIEL